MTNFAIEKISDNYLVKDNDANSVFSKHKTYFDAAISLAMLKQGFETPPNYWVVDDFLMEGFLGGKLIGELKDHQIDPSTALMFSQDEFDALMNSYREVHGHFPDS